MPSPRWPVLMYHKVGAENDRFLNVSAHDFAAQMKLLRRLGYGFVPFASVVRAIRGEISLPPKSVAITFDDAYQCVYGHAFPTLHALQAPGTLFVVSDAVGQTNGWDELEGHAALPLMDWNSLEQAHKAGWEIGGHTRTHSHLDSSPDDAALADIAEGREALVARFGKCETFCYPFGHYNANTPKFVEEAGFLGACTTQTGRAIQGADPYLIPRVKVSYGDHLAGFVYRMFVRPYMPNTRKMRRDRLSDASVGRSKE